MKSPVVSAESLAFACRCAGAASLLAASCLLTGSLVAAQPARIYHDLTHGGLSVSPDRQKAVAAKAGAELVDGNGPLTGTALAGARALYLRTPTKPFTADEKAAVAAFVRGGGSLCVVFDEERRTPLVEVGINDLLEPLGFRLTADTDYLHNCGAIARRGEINAGDRELPYSGGRAVEGGTAFAWRLGQDAKPAQPSAAWKKLANGARIVVMAEAMPSLFLGTPQGERLTGVPRDPARTTFWGKDSERFMQEVFAWLVQR